MASTQSFTDRQQEQVNRLEISVTNMKKDVQQAHTEQLNALQAKREEIAASAAARRKDAEEQRNKLRVSIDAMRAELAAAYREEKIQENVDKLESYAQDAEGYAIATATAAHSAIEEARAAALEAIEARRKAHEAEAGR